MAKPEAHPKQFRSQSGDESEHGQTTVGRLFAVAPAAMPRGFEPGVLSGNC